MIDSRIKALRLHRRRQRRRGLKRVEVQVPAGEVAVIRKAAAILRAPNEEAADLRRHLGLAEEQQRALTAIDIFAMPEPLSDEGERLWQEAMKQIARARRDPRLSRLRDRVP